MPHIADYTSFIDMYEKYQDLKDKYYEANRVKPRPETYVTDEDKSVKWNKEQVEKFNSEIEANKAEALEKSNKAYEEYRKTILNTIMVDLKISKDMAYILVADKIGGKDYDTESDRLEAIEDLVYTILEVIDDRNKLSEGK